MNHRARKIKWIRKRLRPLKREERKTFRCDVEKCDQAVMIWITLRLNNMSPISQARAQGWVIWSGKSLTGKPINTVLCPFHGHEQEERAPEPEPVEAWEAHCHTCGAHAEEEYGGKDLPLDRYEAEEWAAEHECEPDTSVRKK